MCVVTSEQIAKVSCKQPQTDTRTLAPLSSLVKLSAGHMAALCYDPRHALSTYGEQLIKQLTHISVQLCQDEDMSNTNMCLHASFNLPPAGVRAPGIVHA